MDSEPFTHETHYVPQSYMWRFSPDGDKLVHAYRTLVPHEGMRLWKHCSTKGIAVRRDLYTSVAEGEESDRLEKWLKREVEDPAKPVLDKLISRTPLTAADRRKLARYIASLDARSPRYYSWHTQAMSEALPGLIDAEVKRGLAAVERGEQLPDVPDAPTEYPILAVKLHEGEPDADNAHLDVNVVVGRESWLHSIRYVVNEVSKFLEPHDWRVIRPHDGWTWYTSDAPVLRLVLGHGEYHFNGKYGDLGTEIMLPLSPSELLYARVGEATRHEQFSLFQTYFVKRFIAEHAYRWIVSASQVKHAGWFRPRLVDVAQYESEEGEWSEFHEKQSNAILDLRRKDDDSVGRAS